MTRWSDDLVWCAECGLLAAPPVEARFCPYCGRGLGSRRGAVAESLRLALAEPTHEDECIHQLERSKGNGAAGGAAVAAVPSAGCCRAVAPTAGAYDVRFPLLVVISPRAPSNFYAGLVGDREAPGLFIATHAPAVVGEWVALTFRVEGLADPCTTRGQVEWVRQPDPGRIETAPGMGVRLGALCDTTLAAVRRYIARVEPIFFEL